MAAPFAIRKTPVRRHRRSRRRAELHRPGPGGAAMRLGRGLIKGRCQRQPAIADGRPAPLLSPAGWLPPLETGRKILRRTPRPAARHGGQPFDGRRLNSSSAAPGGAWRGADVENSAWRIMIRQGVLGFARLPGIHDHSERVVQRRLPSAAKAVLGAAGCNYQTARSGRGPVKNQRGKTEYGDSPNGRLINSGSPGAC